MVKQYTGKPKPSELTVLTKAKDLAQYVITVTEKTPKKYRFTFVSRMQNLCFDVLSDIFQANNVYVGGPEAERLLAERRRFQQRAKTNVRLLAYIADMAQCNKALTFHQYEVICRHATEVLRLLGGWITSDRKRFSKNKTLISAESGDVAEYASADVPAEQA